MSSRYFSRPPTGAPAERSEECPPAPLAGHPRERRPTAPRNALPLLSPATHASAIRSPRVLPSRTHLRWLADTRGVTGIVANGHAAEVSSLSREERRRALGIALDEVGPRCPVVAGVYADGTHEAVELAKDARAEGAAGVLVFPP